MTRAGALLDGLSGRSRGEVKRLAEVLDREPGLREAVVAEARRRGVALPDDAVAWPAKRLLRRARGLEGEARERTNPIRRDEGFTCAHCGREVPPLGATARDHCPACLRSLHVDVVPGDRAAACHGVLDPVDVALVAGHPVIRFRCRRCGAERRNRASLEGQDPDRWEQVVAVSAGEAADGPRR